MDGNTGNVYPKHKQRNNSDNKIQTNSKKSKKSVNQFKKNTCNTKQVGKKPRRRRNKKKKKFNDVNC